MMNATHFFAAVAAIGLGAATFASQAPGAAPQTVPAARAPQPVLPVAVTVLAAKPDAYVGGMVTLTAAVDQRFGATAFSVVQGRAANAAARDLLVLASVLTAPVEPGAYVTVIGEVVRFDPADLAVKMKGSAPELSADTIAKYRGRPAIVATSVINGAMTDLAKRLPPPMSPEEQALSRQMKLVGPGFNALRQAVTAASSADAAAHAAALNKAFGEAGAFWKTRTHPDALQWNEDAKRETNAIAAAAGRGDWDAVKTSVPKLQSVCSSCHGQYRERLDDGTYRFKPAVAR
jgi:cytochrome c556